MRQRKAMKITSIEVIPVIVPMDPARVITSARGTHARSPFGIVVVNTDEGLVGLGEVSGTHLWSGEDGSTAAHIVDSYLAPALTGLDPTRVLAVSEVLNGAVAGHYFTKAGVEMALWDLVGKVHDMPVHELFGGPVRPRARTKFSVTGATLERSATAAGWAKDQGFTTMKVKLAVGGHEADLARFATVREAVGDEVTVGVDANGGWTRDQVNRAIPPLLDLGMAFLEQPLTAADLEGMAELRRGLPVPLVADESNGTPAEAAAIIRAGAADILSVYVGMSGGLAPARAIASMAHAAGLGWMIGSNLELGIATSAHIQLALSVPGLAVDIVPCDIISRFYYLDDVVKGELPVEAGYVGPTTGPGLGVELDQAAIERHRDGQ